MADIKRLPGATARPLGMATRCSLPRNGQRNFFHPAAERNAAREQRIAQAKAVCRTCPAIAECLAHALRVREPYGIWGGQSEDERAALLGVESLRYPARVRGDVNQLASGSYNVR